MNLRIVHPFGEREGFGSFDTFFDEKKYQTPDDAAKAKDCYPIDFAQDENGVNYLQGYHMGNPDYKISRRMNIQHFPFGIDVSDDALAVQMFLELKERHEDKKS